MGGWMKIALILALLGLLCIQEAQGLFGRKKGQPKSKEEAPAAQPPSASPGISRGRRKGSTGGLVATGVWQDEALCSSRRGSSSLLRAMAAGAHQALIACFGAREVLTYAYYSQNGGLPAIWGVQDSFGAWSFPEGTVLPKDPTSMARIVAIGNAAGERFQCLLPGRTKPLNPQWIDVPQVPVVEDIDSDRAQAALSALDGKCFYRNNGWWTYEFCYKSHIKQMRIDPHLDKVVEERVIGVYSPWAPFELHHNPDRMDHTDNLHEVGPAWTTALTTVYGDGEECEPGGWWYSCDWVRQKVALILPISRWSAANFKQTRPRQVAVSFKCLRLEEPEKRAWLESANVYLGEDKTPFDVIIKEDSPGVYELQLRSESLCNDPLLYTETIAELSPYGNLNKDITCQSESDGKLYKLEDIPGDESMYHEWKSAFHPFDIGPEDL